MSLAPPQPKSALARTRAILSSGLFEQAYYEERRGRRFDHVGAAAADFLQAGWRIGLNPSPLFDTRFYFYQVPSLLRGDFDPLTHYLEIGRKQGLRTRGGRGRVFEDSDDIHPERFRGRFPPQRERLRGVDPQSIVDVVVPVYRGYSETLRCIQSVLTATTSAPLQLIVIDDASPDADIRAALKAMDDEGLIELHCNKTNLGFVKTANLAFSLSEVRDVVLLNADAEVYNDWLGRLQRHALATARVATVTPFSNNATILSYPYRLESNNIALELEPEALDKLFADTSPSATVDIPTGIGFCMYVTRTCLNEIGGFDLGFGRGYGEENDFCVRAAAAGWRNLAACDVYVRHRGEVSFGTDAAAAKRSGMAKNGGAPP